MTRSNTRSRLALVPPADGLHQPRLLAEQAGLRYVTDDRPGIARRRAGKGFIYLDATGRRIADAGQLRRIAALGIPPAWTSVWICPLERGHLQATGRDERGRKQYLYHVDWQQQANQTKFARMLLFGLAIPKIRRRVERDLAGRRLTKNKVVATVVKLIDHTMMRVGNSEYVRSNESYGITTLREEHVDVDGAKIALGFRGKGGKFYEVDVHDRRLAKIVQNCVDIPGQELFQYQTSSGSYRLVESNDVNEYLNQATGQPFTAKDFRTWKASVLVAEIVFREKAACRGEREAKKIVNEAIRYASRSLGNTLSTCRKYYVHPCLGELFVSGRLKDLCNGFRPRATPWLEPREQVLIHILKKLPGFDALAHAAAG